MAFVKLEIGALMISLLSCQDILDLSALRGFCTSYQKLAYVFALSQINQQLFEKWIMHLIKKLFKELKMENGTEILVGHAVFKLQIKRLRMLFLDQ